MVQNFTNLSRAEKIMLVIYKISGGSKKNLKYEDIVVAVFKKFNDDFHLRGYPEFPDSGDLVHKPLYDFRKRGLIEANNKVFSLTDRGISFAEQLTNLTKGKNLTSNGRLSRYTEKEVSRIESLEGFILFTKDKKEKITDTDFYTYFGVTPRTPRNDFLGRIKTVHDAIQELGKQKSIPPSHEQICKYDKFLTEKFKGIISFFKSK